MKILTFSDLHCEQSPDWTIPQSFPDYDVCVVSGDIAASPARSIHLLANAPALRDRPIVFVAGNHEFYGSTREDAVEEGKAAAAKTGVHYLDGETIVIGRTRFVGATLWTDYDLYKDREAAMRAADASINDHRLIRRLPRRACDAESCRFRSKDAASLHDRDRMLIETILVEEFSEPIVVVTHHAPSPQSIHPRFGDKIINAAFASDLEAVMLRWKPALWLHGHTHDSFDYRVGVTRVFANPKGYGPAQPDRKTWENPAFDPHCVIDLTVPNSS